MAVSRPLLLVLLGTLLAASTFLAARGARETSADPAPAVQAAAPTVDKVTPAPTKDPKAEPDKAGSPEKTQPKADATTPGKPDNRGDLRNLPVKKSGPTVKLKVPAGVPRRIGRALARKRVVVLFFAQGGADDQFTAEAVRSVRGQKGVSVFRDDIERLAVYRRLTNGLGVAQAPATVVIGPDREAQLIEGFVDGGTLRQLVVDAR